MRLLFAVLNSHTCQTHCRRTEWGGATDLATSSAWKHSLKCDLANPNTLAEFPDGPWTQEACRDQEPSL